MTADAPARCVTRPSVTMVFIILDKFLFWRHPLFLSECLDISWWWKVGLWCGLHGTLCFLVFTAEDKFMCSYFNRSWWLQPPARFLNLLGGETEILQVKLGQYHGCWCPGSPCRQAISRHGDCTGWMGTYFPWGRISTSCATYILRNWWVSARETNSVADALEWHLSCTKLSIW